MIRLVLLALLLAVAAPVSAQALPGSEPLSVVMSPEYPRPYQTFTVAPRSSLIDLASSNVSVSVNGSVVYRGSGTGAVNIRAGALGERTTVVVTVVDPSGKTHTLQSIVRPAEVSLVMEPVSTVHPFYKGGSLVASEGRVRLVAIADLRTDAATRLPASSLVYTWRLGDRVLTDASGIGKSTLIAEAPVRYRNANITVTVTNPQSTLVGEASTVVSAADPFMRIYRNDPLLGPDFDTALSGRYSMADTEATFRAVSYFFAVPPTLAWSVNNGGGGGDKDITVRATGSGKGAAQLSIAARAAEYYQSAESRLTVEFGAGGGLGFFGL